MNAEDSGDYTHCRYCIRGMVMLTGIHAEATFGHIEKPQRDGGLGEGT